MVLTMDDDNRWVDSDEDTKEDRTYFVIRKDEENKAHWACPLGGCSESSWNKVNTWGYHFPENLKAKVSKHLQDSGYHQLSEAEANAAAENLEGIEEQVEDYRTRCQYRQAVRRTQKPRQSRGPAPKPKAEPKAEPDAETRLSNMETNLAAMLSVMKGGGKGASSSREIQWGPYGDDDGDDDDEDPPPNPAAGVVSLLPQRKRRNITVDGQSFDIVQDALHNSAESSARIADAAQSIANAAAQMSRDANVLRQASEMITRVGREGSKKGD